MDIRENHSLISIHIFLKKILSYLVSDYPKLKMPLYKKPPLEICFLSTNWVLIEVKIYMAKVTRVILYPGMEHGPCE